MLHPRVVTWGMAAGTERENQEKISEGHQHCFILISFMEIIPKEQKKVNNWFRIVCSCYLFAEAAVSQIGPTSN